MFYLNLNYININARLSIIYYSLQHALQNSFKLLYNTIIYVSLCKYNVKLCFVQFFQIMLFHSIHCKLYYFAIKKDGCSYIDYDGCDLMCK